MAPLVGRVAMQTTAVADLDRHAPLQGRRRILVVGSGGAGKSTFARALGAALQLPVIHLDRHYWRPGWVPTPAAEWNAVVAQLAAQDAWIMDGNYSGSLPVRLPRCDAMVFLDFPRTTCLWRVLKRRISATSHGRPDKADRCRERLTLEFVLWVWRYPKRSRRRILAAIEQNGARIETIRLTRPSEANKLLRVCASS
jgi:adenylate kinase family enzyme